MAAGIGVAAAYVATYAVASLALAMAFNALMGAVFKPRTTNSFTAEAQGRTQIVRSNVQPRNLIYGKAMTSGPLVFAASTDGAHKNQYMHLVVALADHTCEAIDEVYLGDQAVGPLDGNGQPTGGRFRKVWGESRTRFVAVPPGHTAFTLSTGVPVLTLQVAVAKCADGRDVAITDVSWSEGSDSVTVRGLPDDAETVVVTFEERRSNGLVVVHKHLGWPEQEADPDLVAMVPGWSAEHRLRGVCYLYVRLEYDADVFPNGLPNIKALVRGKRVYDPRGGTVAWSDNWALCVYDYLCDERGFSCAAGDVDLATVMAAANVSDEAVRLADGTTQQRYRCNGIVMLDKSPRDNLTEMTTAGAGSVVISGGVFRVFAGAYDIPTMTLTEDDLRGAMKVQARMSRRDLFNVVKGTYVNPANGWLPGDFPAVSNALYAGQDGESIERDIELPFTTDGVMAQRLAKIILERSRQGIVVEFPAKLSAFRLTAYSTVKLSSAKFGWAEKTFRVMSWKMSDDGGVDLVLNEEAPSVYDWNAGDATSSDPAPDTNLPNPLLVEPVGQIRLESGSEQLVLSQTGVVTSRVRVIWPAAQDAQLRQSGRVELQYKRADAQDWTSLAPLAATATSGYLMPVEDGAPYVVRARYVSGIGVRSPDWTYSPVHVVVGKLAPPEDVTGFSLSALSGSAHLVWDPATDLDVRNGGRASIRHTSNLMQPEWGSAIDIGGYVAGAANSAQLPLLTGVYLIKWVDSSGNESVTASEVATTAPSLQGLNVVATVSEQPAFAGAKDKVIFDRALGGIKLIGNGLIDSQGPVDASGLWDDAGQIDRLGAIDAVVGAGGWPWVDSLGGVASSGSYTFANALDLGRIETSRLTATIDALGFDTGDLFDVRPEPLDTWQSIDGDRLSDAGVTLFVRHTRDDPARTPAWSPWERFAAGDYEARAFQWRAELRSLSSAHNVLVAGLTVTVDMPDRIAYGRGVVSAAGAQAVVFDPPFHIVPKVGITAQNMVQGDYFTISAPNERGFTVNFYNAAGAAISRRFDWDAVGY
ncbi:hypothetical protein BKK80_32735 [Cupriavidus malaysiensis]|uniref:Tip attachment protein J domain-containing protein n=2 Tax=Cupriavidus malaysiensis TaxID=367825 RepID=A0ABN4TX97_9BURK|nr:hypothetical protein BKK80_32735 [Cupriavidus malaysiensis]